MGDSHKDGAATQELIMTEPECLISVRLIMCLTSHQGQLIWSKSRPYGGLVEVATDAALLASKCVTSSWVALVAEPRTIWSVITERRERKRKKSCCHQDTWKAHKPHLPDGMSVCKVGGLVRGKGMRLAFAVALKTMWGNFRTDGGYMFQRQQKDGSDVFWCES